jgi:hypothetical protein
VTAFIVGFGYHFGSKGQPLSFPKWAVIALALILLVIALLSTLILWPIEDFAYGPSPTLLLNHPDAKDRPSAAIEDITRQCMVSHSTNLRKMKPRYLMFRFSSLALMCEVLVLVLVLFRTN